jgi:Bacterial Ig-like domain
MRRIATAALFVIAAVLVHPGVGLATVKVGQPFPTNLYTVRDHTQATGLRVNLPKPDCAVRPSDCADIDVLNQLDGFNIQPRISIPFSGPIDASTVSSSTVFLVGPHFNRVGIDQIVWEQATNTLHAETDEQLREATTYLLVVTRGIRGPNGQRIKAGAVSLFTTQSIRSISRKIRRQLRKVEPSFVLGSGGVRTVFPLSSVTSVTWKRQISTEPAFSENALFLPLLAGVGTIAFGSYESPDYETAAKVIPAVGTRTGKPRPRERTMSSSRSSCRQARRRQVAGPSRSSGTGSPIGRTVHPMRSPARLPRTESRRLRSTSSGTAEARSAPTPSTGPACRP